MNPHRLTTTATSYDPRYSSPASHDDTSAYYMVAVVVSLSFLCLLLNACHCLHLNKEAQEAEAAAGLHPAVPPSSGGGGDDTAVGPRQQQQPPAPAPAARLTVEEMALRSTDEPVVVCTYWKAEGWAEATCAVCLAELDDGVAVRVLPVCMHYFHAACVAEWLLAHQTCPLCRAPLDPPGVAGAPA
ncbi:hypothetical protein BS78_05G284000 [Paspalum vaginatum]|nr:hypothetical protein BS78_05G284000 [Paspalum vaginatum]